MLNANRTTATVRTYGNHEITDSKAPEVKRIACASFKLEFSAVTFPVIIKTKAVIVQTTTVSIKGSSNATKPSEARKHN